MRKLHNGGNAQVFRITGARQGLADDVRGRQRRYVISMSVRTVSVILAATLWNVERPVAIVALVLGATLPYIAVVIANAGRENAPSLPSSFINVPTRPMIAPPHEKGTSSAWGSPRSSEAESGGEARSGTGTAESVPEDAPAEPAAGIRSEPGGRS
ncbi:DUF3099 domain-containing protein [Streptomyces yaanensis]|uniref:DUF3099 domain-containing protein n=1 Tax=Streptomyces yaanensis TaxID=1142239 RepID=A0ABV7SGF7_9ACTN|nr:DUF3099 domain-containing protein [Streptomyces sp. CGMCC 4.7035]WNC01051.1 DUF3099 domain-containing protein [Streptomyces sp. CGMCC 4.7035]